MRIRAVFGFPGGSHSKESAAVQEMRIWSLGQEESSEGGGNNPLKYSYLGNPMDRGAWQLQRDRTDWHFHVLTLNWDCISGVF